MSFTLKQLKYFVAAAEQGSITHAAHKISVSQSRVTEAIKELEAGLGVPLLERHARGVNLTIRGHQFLRHATMILTQVADAHHAFQEGGPETEGRLLLGVTPLLSGYVLSDILSKYRRVMPKIKVETLEEDSEHLEHLLIGGELDVALMVTSNQRDHFALKAEGLVVSAFRLWLPLGHRLTKKDSISVLDLSEEPLILLNIDEMEQEMAKLTAVLGTRAHIAFRTRSVEAVRSLVATGAGVAVLPDLVYRQWSLEGDKIESRTVSGSLPTIELGVVWRNGLPLTIAAREFVEVSKRHHAPIEKR